MFSDFEIIKLFYKGDNDDEVRTTKQCWNLNSLTVFFEGASNKTMSLSTKYETLGNPWYLKLNG